MGTIIVGIIAVVGVVLVLSVGLTAVLTIVIGLGWVLTQIIPAFSLFEAAVLIILAGVVTRVLIEWIIEFFKGVDLDDFDLDTFPYEDNPHNAIVIDRFAKTEAEFDGEAYFRYHIANAIFDDLNDIPRTVGLSTQREIIELSIRLTDPVVSILKRRKKWTARVTITVAAMKKELNQMGLRAYDKDILETAVESVNDELEVNERLRNIVNDHEWDNFSPS